MADRTAFFYGTSLPPKTLPPILTPQGTLMAPAVLHRVIHGTSTPLPYQSSLVTIRPALLPSFQRHKVLHADYPAIIPANRSASVRGTLVTGLTEGDIWRLDIFEGYEYERRKVRVRVLDREMEVEEVEAEVYVWVAGKQRLESSEWDFDEFVREKMGRWIGKEAEGEYAGRASIVEVDDAVAAQQGKADPTGGRGLNGNITKTLEGDNERAKAIESVV
ncbi:hypothetical protein K432DRAFT_293789 [Lepidopterella palustris CBS 459.81]|uniref:Putative gamma-glutamylcyclotransferase n=1 Tax=Lepidopterella palustris CBS 459.81 TaxID=1314670 RepID=A0A8E2JGX9_9PEZI|nr:hypothetical protein K432DRAFT_293789 [Lepidopterella palustris CBS 459.81]